MSQPAERPVTLTEMKVFRKHIQTAANEIQQALDLHILNQPHIEVLVQGQSNLMLMLKGIQEVIDEEEKEGPLQ